MRKYIQLLIVILAVVASVVLKAQPYVISSSGPTSVCGNASGNLTVNAGGSSTVVQWEVGTFNGVFTVESTTVTSNTTFPYNVTAQGTKAYRVKVADGSGTSYSNVLQITANTAVDGGTITTSQPLEYNLVSGSGTFYVSGYTGSPSWQRKVYGIGIWATVGTGTSYAYSGLTETSSFRVLIVNGNGTCTDASNELEVKVYKPGTVAVNGSSSVAEGSLASLTLTGNYGGVARWEYSTDAGASWSAAVNTEFSYTHKIGKNTRFRVIANQGPFAAANSNAVDVTALSYTSVNQPLVSGGNYVRDHLVVVSGVTNAGSVDALPAEQKRQVTTFQDGFGRPVQTNSQKGSPLQKDLVGLQVYDSRGQQPTKYIPYASTASDGAYRAVPFTEQLSFYANGTGDKVADSSHPFAKTINEKSSLRLVTEKGMLGQEWQPGAGHSTLVAYGTCDANEIRAIKSDGSSSGFYGLNELMRVEVTDPDGKKTQRLTDKAGQMLVMRTELSETVDGTLTPWLETYYVYNENGSLKYIISPKGIAALKLNGWSLTQAIKDQFVYEFAYDNVGRLVEKKVPGQAWIYMCYDRLDRLVLMQDANVRSANKWFFIKYDRSGRPVMQGLYQNTTHTTRAAVQSNLLDPLYALDTDKHYEVRGSTLHGYTNQSFPTSATEIYTVNYYDTYDFDFNGTDDFAYAAQGLANENTPIASALGKPTGSKRVVLGTATWLSNYVFYDRNGRMIQARSNNHLSATVDNITTAVYDFEGKMKILKMYHNAGSSGNVTVLNRYEYDHMGRLLKVYQNNNAAPTDQLVAQYEYNELGQVVDKKLHNTTGTTFLQSVDMRYSIQGWLASINSSQLTNDGAINDDTGDYFGMEFLFNKTESGLTTSTDHLFNGNVSAIKWKAAGTAAGANDQRSYKLTYDKANRLKTATSQMHTGGAWTKEAGALNEQMTYDLNGNILTLKRNQRKHQIVGTTVSYVSEAIDDLTYTYNASIGDQLLKVTDAAVNAPAGFNNGGSGTSNDYTYDVNGAQLSDQNKGISGITYNALGKATQVSFTDTRKIEYVYDAGGTKLTMKAYAAGMGTPHTVTDYVDNFVYENGVLRFFSSPEGRVVKNGANLQYEYAIADHQGNTRVVFSSVNSSVAPIATFENAASDALVFQNVSTSSTYWVSKSAANNTPSGQYVMRMNNTYQTGPAKSVKVFPGDVIGMEVWAYYEGSSGFGGSNQPLNTLITSVAGALTGGVAPGEASLITTGVNSAYTLYGAPGNLGDTRPSAFLNYILLDRNYKLIDMGWQPVTTASNMSKQKVMFNPKTITEAGFLYVYLSYEGVGTNWVYFDDLKITHTKTNVVQYNEYYPFGLQTNASWTREDSKNEYLYNSGSELNITSGLYEMFYRNYDPAIGRMTSIDPLATNFAWTTGYNYGYNNPTTFSDPSGAAGIHPWAWDGYMGRGTDLSNEQWIDASRPYVNPEYNYNASAPYQLQVQMYQIWKQAMQSGETEPAAIIYSHTEELSYLDENGEEVNTEVEVLDLVELLYGDEELDPNQADKSKSWLENEQTRWGLLFDGEVLAFLDFYPNAMQIGGFGGGATATVKGVQVALNGSKSAAPVVYSVYRAVAKDGKVYWGMTKDFAKRAAQHGDRFVEITKVYTNIGSKAAARGIEQLMMDAAGGIKYLDNAINSISRNNPKIMEYYREASRYLEKINK